MTYNGRFTHISGHPSAAGRAQDMESSPVKDRRSTNCATQPTDCGTVSGGKTRQMRYDIGGFFKVSEAGAWVGMRPRPVPSSLTAHPSTASGPVTVLLYDGPLLGGFNVAIRRLIHCDHHTLSMMQGVAEHT